MGSDLKRRGKAMKARTASLWLALVLNIVLVASAHAGEPWINLLVEGKTPFQQSQVKLAAGSDVVEAAWFESLPLSATLEVGLGRKHGGDRECGAFTIPADWPDRVDWTWARTDGREAEVLVRGLEHEVRRTTPVALVPGGRTSARVTVPALAPGLYKVSVAMKIDGCAGRPGVVRSTPILVEVFRGTESVEARCALLEIKIDRTTKYEDWRPLMEELAELAPRDTGPYEKLAFAAATHDDMDSALRYHAQYVEKVKTRMTERYGAITNWPSETQAAFRAIEGRDKALGEAVPAYNARRDELRITVIRTSATDADFALVRRTDGKVERLLK